jgi:hypothetical protein
LSVLIAFSSWALGQESLSTLRGTVTDRSGAVVPGVEVTAREVLTNIMARTVITDEQGNYEMPGLKASRYQVTATMTGFKKFVVEDVTLQSNQVRRVDVILDIGEVASEVSVSAAAAVIQTEQGKIGADFNSAKRYWDLPVPGNAFSGTYAVLAILADVQRQPGDWGSPAFAGQYGNQVHMGQDGIKEETLNSQTVNMEAVQELKLVSVNNTAEYARVGYFDTITKSGTNEYHGEVSYYHRNSALGARNFFEDEKAPVIYHTMNASASGPIFKNKTFFYGLWNGERVPGSAFYLRSVPTEKMRRGDFSELLALSSPVVINDPLTGTPFTGNVIPQARITSVAQGVQETFYPLPNRPGLANNFGFIHPYPDDQFHADVFSVRVDHRLTQKNSFYGRIQGYLPRYVLAGSYPTTTGTRLRQSHAWVFTDTHVFSPKLVNNFTFGGNRDGIKDSEVVDGIQPPSASDLVKKLGIQGVNQAGVDRPGGSPVFAVTGYSTISVQAGGFQVGGPHLTFSDNVTWATGKHVVKIGFEQRTYGSYDERVPNDNFGNFVFNGSFSGNAYADFILGLPFSSTRLNPIVNRQQNTKELGIFIADTFKVSTKLTLDVGLRWDRFSATTFEDGLMFNWDPQTGNVVVPESALASVSPLYPKTINIVTGQVVPDPDLGKLVPRIGLAYRLTDKTVIRGGYGIYNEFFGRFARVQGGGPFQLTETYNNVIQNGVPLFQMPNPFPSAGVSATVPSQSVTGFPLQTSNGKIHQFNVSAERQIGDIGLRLSYIGSRSRGLNYSLSTNKPQPSLIPFTSDRRPYPQFVGTTEFRSDGRANYDSLSFEANRRVGMLTFDIHWTWAHGMNDFLNLENPYSPRMWNRDFFAKHRVVFNTVWELPFGRGNRYLSNIPAAADQIVGGWRMVWVIYLQNGQYFSPSFSGRDPSNTNTVGGRPDRICDGNVPPDQREIDRWFDVSCFAPPPAGRFGNSGVDILEGPGLHTHNVTFLKKFRFTERVSFDLMGLVSNIFNHPNFFFPGSNISVPGDVGVLNETHGLYSGERAGQRMVEFRARLQF